MENYILETYQSINKDNYQLFFNNYPQRYYVYALYDSSEHKIFYIGKGSNKRAWNHLKLSGSNQPKIDYIKNLYLKGVQPQILILLDNLAEIEAYSCEGTLIKKYYSTLTNIQGCTMAETDVEAYLIKKYGKENLTYSDVTSIEDAEVVDLKDYIESIRPVLKHGIVVDNMILYSGKCYNYQQIKRYLQLYG